MSLATTLAAIWLILASLLSICHAQVSSDELDPLLRGLAQKPSVQELEKRVPLMTDDPTTAPLVSLQVFAPPAVPHDGTSCSIELMKHTFGVFLPFINRGMSY